MIQALDRQAISSARRRLFVSSVVVAAAVALSVSWSNTPTQTIASPPAGVSRAEHEATENELTRMRQLFTFCRSSSVNWSDERCAAPSTSRGNILPVTDRAPSSDNDDSGDNDHGGDETTVIVQQPRPTASPSRGSQRPGTKPRTGPSETAHGHGDGHGENGDRVARSGRE